MKDELFTMAVPELPGVSPEVRARWQEEVNRNFLRMKHFSEMVMNPKEPALGPTPRQEIYRKNKSRLYRYESKRTHRTPVLFVPNLGISRPYIFDLMPKGSFMEHMTQQGFDMYLVDWGIFGPEDNGLSFEDVVTKILPRMAQKALESSGAREISVLGYCMGAPISASFLGANPEFPLKNFVDMAGPIVFLPQIVPRGRKNSTMAPSAMPQCEGTSARLNRPGRRGPTRRLPTVGPDPMRWNDSC